VRRPSWEVWFDVKTTQHHIILQVVRLTESILFLTQTASGGCSDMWSFVFVCIFIFLVCFTESILFLTQTGGCGCSDMRSFVFVCIFILNSSDVMYKQRVCACACAHACLRAHGLVCVCVFVCVCSYVWVYACVVFCYEEQCKEKKSKLYKLALQWLAHKYIHTCIHTST